MIMITGQKGILSSRQARFQIVDVVASMKPLTKLSRQIVSPTIDPDAGARGVPRRRGGAARPRPSRTSGRHRRAKTCEPVRDGPAASASSCPWRMRCARSGGRDDPAGQSVRC